MIAKIAAEFVKKNQIFLVDYNLHGTDDLCKMYEEMADAAVKLLLSDDYNIESARSDFDYEVEQLL